MTEPPFRCSTRAAIDFVAHRLGLRNEPDMQDWEVEVADPSDLPRYLDLFQEVDEEDVRFTLADLIIQAFESSDIDLSACQAWAGFLSRLAENTGTHGWQLWYWASWDVGPEDAWRVSPFMRALCKEHLVSKE